MYRLQKYVLIGIICVLPGAVPVWAGTFTVNNTTDAVDNNPGDGACETAPGNVICTLRGAIQETNALAGADVINVPAGTFTLTIPGTGEDASATGDLDITEDVEITGAGAGSTVIDGNGIDRVFQILNATVAISDVTITRGVNPDIFFGFGGGIANGGTLTLTNSTVSANTAKSGGGIVNLGVLTLNRSTISGNTADDGGGISNAGTATLTDSTVNNNAATDSGGIDNGGPMILNNSTLSGNTADDGGPLTNNGTLTLNNSTVSGNRSFAGSLFENSGTMILNNSTLSGNTHIGPGGGNYTLKNTIVANNNPNDCLGFSITSAGYNLIENASACTIGGNLTGNITGVDPVLGPLADNGGPTQTHALLAGTPAIDAGSSDCPPPATDQRGVVRPQGTACDIGAFELFTPTALQLFCVGFEPPMDAGPVTVKKNRVLPLKAQLFESVSNPITDLDIVAPPVIQILFTSGITPAEDVTAQALSAGQGTEGNQFEFGTGKWQFNLNTKNYTAAGTYTISMVSGDESEYTIGPTCMAEFVIE